MKKLLLLLPIVFAIGCATTVHQLNTASGRPEVFIANATKAKVQGALTDILVSEGAELANESNSMMEFVRKHGFVDAPINLMPRAEILKFTFLEQKDGVKVFANGLIDTSAYSHPPYNNNNSPRMMTSKEDVEMLQGILDKLKARSN
ncbi:MAG: hypothetical protein V1746_06165 [bacterium]